MYYKSQSCPASWNLNCNKAFQLLNDTPYLDFNWIQVWRLYTPSHHGWMHSSLFMERNVNCLDVTKVRITSQLEKRCIGMCSRTSTNWQHWKALVVFNFYLFMQLISTFTNVLFRLNQIFRLKLFSVWRKGL